MSSSLWDWRVAVRVKIYFKILTLNSKYQRLNRNLCDDSQNQWSSFMYFFSHFPSSPPLLMSAENFTLFIRNSVRFPLFGVTRWLISDVLRTIQSESKSISRFLKDFLSKIYFWIQILSLWLLPAPTCSPPSGELFSLEKWCLQIQMSRLGNW